MTFEDLNHEYDLLQMKYGDKSLHSIYNGGCSNNPDICFVFMNPTGRNVASLANWHGIYAPWIGQRIFGIILCCRTFRGRNLFSN